MRNKISIVFVVMVLSGLAHASSHIQTADLVRGLDTLYPIQIGAVEQTSIFNPKLLSGNTGTQVSDRARVKFVFPVAVSAHGQNGYVGHGSIEVTAIMHVSKTSLVFEILDHQIDYGDLPMLYRTVLLHDFTNHEKYLGVTGIPLLPDEYHEKLPQYSPKYLPRVTRD